MSKSDTDAASKWMREQVEYFGEVDLSFPAEHLAEISWPPLQPDKTVTFEEFLRIYLTTPVTDDQLRLERVTARLQGWEDESYHVLALRYLMYLRGIA